MAKGKPVYNQQGRVCGAIEGKRLTKTVHANHMLQQPPGWAWDKSIIQTAIRQGVEETVLYDRDAQIVYSASLRSFLAHGVEIERGFGPQIVLPLGFWTTRKRGERRATQPGLL